MGAGALWVAVFPLNKALWTSSFVLYSAGWAQLLWGGLYYCVEVCRWHRLAVPFEILGRNSIFIFVASCLGARVLQKVRIGEAPESPSAYAWLYQNVFAVESNGEAGSLCFATGYYSVKDIVKSGFILNVLSWIIFVLVIKFYFPLIGLNI